MSPLLLCALIATESLVPAPTTTPPEPATTTTTTPTTTPPPPTTTTPDRAGPRIYIVKPALSGMPPSLVATIVSTMAQAIGREGFDVMTADDVKTVLEQQVDLALLGGESDPLALSALATAVGADMLVAAVVTSIDGDTVVQTRLIDPKKGAVLARRELKASEQNNEVLPTIENAARLVLQPLLAVGRASVKVAVSEEGANVVVDGDVVGVSPLDKAVGLTGGLHQIVVTKEGFIRFQETVRVKSGDTLTRDVKLRPSVEFLTNYNASAGLYRTLAWTSTAGVVVGLGVLTAGSVGYVGALDNLAKVTADGEKRIKDEQIPETDPRIAEIRQEQTEASNATIPWSATAITGGVVAGVTVLLATYFWAFGNDPGKYDDVEAAVH
ncbi:MAG: PEGA domain-containing protein [Deltaproteobacteria bacterium]|nr:PEGA domain-containing protein [Deltaproteobacteria bacterium]